MLSTSSNSMRSTFIIAPIIALWALSQQVINAQVSPEAQTIIDQIVEGHGGKEALRKLETRESRCVLDLKEAGLTFKFEILSKVPNKRTTTMIVPGYPKIVEGFDGTAGWNQTQDGTIQRKQGAALQQLIRESWFPRELHLGEMYEEIDYVGRERIDGNEVQILALKSGLHVEKIYADARSGLIRRYDQVNVVGAKNEPMTVQVYYEDYRAIDGVQIPFRIRVPEPRQFQFTMKVESVVHNHPIADKIFSKPE